MCESIPAEETVQSLSEAINTGDKAEAIRCVEQLLTLNVPVCMRLTPEAYSQECIRYIHNILLIFPSSWPEILRAEHSAPLIHCRLRVGVEDALSDAYITMLVTPGMTISELKQKVQTYLNTVLGFMQCVSLNKLQRYETFSELKYLVKDRYRDLFWFYWSV